MTRARSGVTMRRSPERLVYCRRTTSDTRFHQLSAHNSRNEFDVPSESRHAWAGQPSLAHDIPPNRLPLGARRDKLWEQSCEQHIVCTRTVGPSSSASEAEPAWSVRPQETSGWIAPLSQTTTPDTLG